MNYRSKFEGYVAQQLESAGIKFHYEEYSYGYNLPVYKGECLNCGSTHDIVKWHSYTPDFFLENGIILEAKGKLEAKHRKLLVAVRDQWDLDLRLVFQANNKITRKSDTRYLDWAEQVKIPAVVKEIPESWLQSIQSKK